MTLGSDTLTTSKPSLNVEEDPAALCSLSDNRQTQLSSCSGFTGSKRCSSQRDRSEDQASADSRRYDTKPPLQRRCNSKIAISDKLLYFDSTTSSATLQPGLWHFPAPSLSFSLSYLSPPVAADDLRQLLRDEFLLSTPHLKKIVFSSASRPQL